VNSNKLSSIKFIHGDCASTSGNDFMQPKENSSIIVEAPVCLAEISSNDVLNIGQYEINEKEDTWGLENVLKNRRKKSGTFHPDTVLLPDGQVTTSQGTFTSVRRSQKGEVPVSTVLKTTVFCLHLGGGRYPELPNQTISSIPRYKYNQFWLVLSPVKEQEGQYISLRRLGLLSHGSQTIMRAKTIRVRLV
jgi:hypothetical protein